MVRDAGRYQGVDENHVSQGRFATLRRNQRLPEVEGNEIGWVLIERAES
jgi:hypothetical protein